ncbi:MAG TPA: hypothetical protein VHW44_00155 [Pseudonocardiaceae bacterium]|nr:hypothetical protein [Pseudonocardiaceae bacterium]
MNTTISIIIGIAVLALLLFRQTQKRSVREDRKPTLLLILAVIGVLDLVNYLKDNPANGTAIAMLTASLVLAAGFGVIRAYTVRLWREDGTLWRQGNALTIVLWLVAIGLHFGADFLIDHDNPAKGLSSAALMLYIAVSFGVQRLVVQSRASHVLAV